MSTTVVFPANLKRYWKRIREKLDLKAPIDSPEFTGEPTSTNPDPEDNSTRIATTEWVRALTKPGEEEKNDLTPFYLELPSGTIVGEHPISPEVKTELMKAAKAGRPIGYITTNVEQNDNSVTWVLNVDYSGEESTLTLSWKWGNLYLNSYISFSKNTYKIVKSLNFVHPLKIETRTPNSQGFYSGNYYNITGVVTNLVVNLSADGSDKYSTAGFLSGFMMNFTTGDTISVNITPPEGYTLSYTEGFEIKPNTHYELNFICNGTEWVVAWAIIK